MNTILLNHGAGSYSVQDEDSGQMVGSLSRENATRQSRWIASRRAARNRSNSLPAKGNGHVAPPFFVGNRYRFLFPVAYGTGTCTSVPLL